MDIGQCGSTSPSAEPSPVQLSNNTKFRPPPCPREYEFEAPSLERKAFQPGLTTCVLGRRCFACVYDNLQNLWATKLPCCCGGCAVAHPGITRIGSSYAQWDLGFASGLQSYLTAVGGSMGGFLAFRSLSFSSHRPSSSFPAPPATFADTLSTRAYLSAVLGDPVCASVNSSDNNVQPRRGIPVEP